MRLCSALPGVLRLHCDRFLRRGRAEEWNPKLCFIMTVQWQKSPLAAALGQDNQSMAEPSVRVHISVPTAVSCSQSCFVTPLKLVELWLTQFACLSVCAHKGERAGAGSCAQMREVVKPGAV